jgi:hypothetical protein
MSDSSKVSDKISEAARRMGARNLEPGGSACRAGVLADSIEYLTRGLMMTSWNPAFRGADNEGGGALSPASRWRYHTMLLCLGLAHPRTLRVSLIRFQDLDSSLSSSYILTTQLKFAKTALRMLYPRHERRS